MNNIRVAVTFVLGLAPFQTVLGANYLGTIEAYRRGDYVNAAAGFESLAKAGDTSSQYYLGTLYLDGLGVPRDQPKAFTLFKQAAEHGHIKAKNALADMYFWARSVPREAGIAKVLYLEAARQNNLDAQRNIGRLYVYEDGYRDYEKAVYWLQKAASRGDAVDQLVLADLYHYNNTIKNHAKSAYWMLKAASQGLAEAQYTMGNYYHSGLGIKKNSALALKWYQRASAQGNADASYAIAGLYRNNDQIDGNQASLTWTCLSAKQGNLNAVFDLTRTGEPSVPCLTDLAENGNELAQEELGRHYENATGDVHNYPLAAYWYRQAAERGYASALNRLGDLYARGNGVPLDSVIAQMLYLIARPKISGTRHTSRIRTPLTVAENNEAEELARSWKEGTSLPSSR